MKFNVRCILCSNVIQHGDKDAPVSYTVCDECKKAISNKLGMKVDAIVVHGDSDEKKKKT